MEYRGRIQTGTRSKQIDQLVAILIRDFKLRGLLDDTFVVRESDFGHSTDADMHGNKVGDGRDHPRHAINAVRSGTKLKKAFDYDPTDERGFHAVENRHYATVLH